MSGPPRRPEENGTRRENSHGERIPQRIVLLTLLLALARPTLAQESPESPEPGKPRPPVQKIFNAIKEEARRYYDDSAAIVTAPAGWSSKEWEKAAGVTLVLGGLMLADQKIDEAAQRNRSRFTDRVSGATTALGGAWGVRVSLGLLGGGLIFRNSNVTNMGREAIEAGFLSSLATNLVLKRGFGRERPSESNGETVFRPGSKHDSFPSGHSTEAFAVASVVAARADGWVIPAVAYTAATLVAFDRVNKRVHFASDVYAGAIIGTFTGRMIVHRHQAQEKADERKKTTDLELVPIRNGLSVRLLF